jgi:hypothetical protein
MLLTEEANGILEKGELVLKNSTNKAVLISIIAIPNPENIPSMT